MNISSEAGLTVLVDSAAKGLVILAVVEAALFVWKRASAATRHATRVAAMLAIVLLPLATWLAPNAKNPVWAVRAERISGNEIALSVQLTPAAPAGGIESVPVDRPTTSPPAYSRELQFRDSWAALVLAVWACGVMVALLPVAVGHWQRWVLLKTARFSFEGDWQKLLATMVTRAGVRRPVRLLVSPEAIIPLTWGSFRPAVLMPECAASWSEERKQATLAHEVAHVQRWDCFTQNFAQFACALYWFNPLIWRCARAMRLDREQACDDLVVSDGIKASSYASHLVEIASTLRGLSTYSGIGMARRSQLEERVVGVMANSRSHQAPRIQLRIAITGAALTLVMAVAAQKAERTTRPGNALRQEHLEQLKRFAAQREKHAEVLTEKNNETIIPEFREFFEVAKKGEWRTVTNMYVDFKTRHSQYGGQGGLPHTAYWSTVLETCLAYTDVTWGEPEHVDIAVRGFMNSIPSGAIYFGGTDPGRGLPTAFSKNHVQADPFFTLTQNALADATYLDYIRLTYGDRIYIPSAEDSNAAFNDYIKDATARYHSGKLKPGENVTIEENRTRVGGVVAVMEINARLAKVIFEKNPDREFYIEESHPLDWMKPHLLPAGQVMKINREPLTTITEEVVRKDIGYWNERLQRFLGEALQSRTGMGDFMEFINSRFVTKTSSKADPRFLANDWAQRAFSKWRSGSAGIYAWRAANATEPRERQRMQDAAELALRQAYALCPVSPEAVHRYATFLTENKRKQDAIRLVETSLKLAPGHATIQSFLSNLEAETLPE